jgi:hypothetical protein
MQDLQAGVMSVQTRRARRGLDDETEERNIKELKEKQAQEQPPGGQ